MNEQQHPPEGWYQDQQDPAIDRWWDGGGWTGATRARVVASSPTGDPRVQVTAPEKPKKKHRIRNTFLIVVGGIVLIGAISSLGSEDPDGTPTAEPDTASGEQARAGEPVEEPADEPVEEPADEPVEEPAENAGPGVGDKAEDGDFTFMVESVEDGPDLIGSESFGVEPQGKFVLVTMTVTNHGDDAGSFFGDNQFLIDTEGRKASADSEAAIYMEDAESLFEEINPGNSLTGVVVFDIPVDAVPAELELHDSMFSGGVTVTVK